MNAQLKTFLINKAADIPSNIATKVTIIRLGHNDALDSKYQSVLDDLTANNIRGQVLTYPADTSELGIEYLVRFLEADSSILGYVFIEPEFAVNYNSPKNISSFYTREEPVGPFIEDFAVTPATEPAEFIPEHIAEETPKEAIETKKPEANKGKFANLKMAELQALLKENNIKFKFGSSKADLIKLLEDNNI